MADPSPFANLDSAQLYYLKAQYLASLQMIDQTEAALKAQLDQVGKSRKQLQDLMADLDAQITTAETPETPAKPAAKPAKKPTPRRPTRRQPITP
jgi:Spy/CpxP family protein refolding chaperone